MLDSLPEDQRGLMKSRLEALSSFNKGIKFPLAKRDIQLMEGFEDIKNVPGAGKYNPFVNQNLLTLRNSQKRRK